MSGVTRSASTSSGGRGLRIPRWAIAALAPVLTLLAYLDVLRFDFVADTRGLIVDNDCIEGWKSAWPNVVHDYFWTCAGDTKLHYWRPLTKLSWVAEVGLFGRHAGHGHAAGFMAVQLAWLVAGVIAVQALARELGASPLWAAAAGLLFGLHPAAVEPACLLMARSDVASVACVVGSMAAWLAWRRTGRRRDGIVHVVLLLVALGSKESAVVEAPALVLWALLLPPGGDSARASSARLASLVPAWACVALYFVLRFAVLGERGAAALDFDAWRLLAGGAMYLRGLVPLSLESGVRFLPHLEARASLAPAIATWTVAALVIGWAAGARDRASLALLALAFASLAPVLFVAQIDVPNRQDNYPLADRWMLLAVAATSILYARAADRILQNDRWRRAAGVVVGAWAAVSLANARLSHAYYASDAALLDVEDRQYEATPAQFRSPAAFCARLDRTVVRALLAGDTGAAIAKSMSEPACLSRGETLFNLLSALVRERRFAEARPLVDRVLAAPGIGSFQEPQMLHMVGLTLLETGDPGRARPYLEEALRLGLPACSLRADLGRTLAALGDADDAATRFAEADACAAAAHDR